MLQYFTVETSYGPKEIKIRGSRFIAFLYPISRAADVSGILAGMRKTYHDASHICYAFRALEGGKTIFRFHDDGEPSGTAGKPIYSEIEGKEYFNTLLVVVRYFGGVKLGTGGLVRAYAQSARAVLQNSKKKLQYIKKMACIFFPFVFTGEIRAILEEFKVEVIRQDYSENGVGMELWIPQAFLDEVARSLRDRCRGMAKLNMDSAEIQD